MSGLAISFANYSYRNIEENFSSIIFNPYLHTVATGTSSLLVGGLWKGKLVEKLAMGGVVGIFLPLSYFTLNHLMKKQTGYDPTFSCLISSASALSGLILFPFLKPASLSVKLVLASVATITTSLNLNDLFLINPLPPQKEEIKSNPKYEFIDSSVESMRS